MPSSSSSSGERLVKVAFAPNEAVAEMIQGLLSEHGIPSMLKRGPGFDNFGRFAAAQVEDQARRRLGVRGSCYRG